MANVDRGDVPDPAFEQYLSKAPGRRPRIERVLPVNVEAEGFTSVESPEKLEGGTRDVMGPRRACERDFRCVADLKRWLGGGIAIDGDVAGLDEFVGVRTGPGEATFNERAV